MPQVEAQLCNAGFFPVTASKQVESLKRAFENLQTLFIFVSILVAAISIFICLMLFTKTMRMRAKEIGVFMALGYSGKQMKQMLLYESLMLSILSTLTTVLLLASLTALSGIAYTQVLITPTQIVFGLCDAFILVLVTTTF